MKKKLSILVFSTFTTMCFCQTNQYSNYSTSSFQPLSADEIMNSYDVEGASMNVFKSAFYYSEKIESLLKKNTEYQFKEDLYNAKGYLNVILVEERPMSISDAKWYVNKAKSKINKAIRKYNKRVKKRNKS